MVPFLHHRFAYIIDNGQIYFYKQTENGLALWTPHYQDAHKFDCQWIPAEPTQEMPNRTQRFADMSEEFAKVNGAYHFTGNPTDLLQLHAKGPQIGQRVRIITVRTDGFVYGTGVVIGYAEILPHFLTHTVELDNPPKASAPDEFGKIYTTDPERLCKTHCPAFELVCI